nr:unnamed protein product [Callosobruchus analis]
MSCTSTFSSETVNRFRCIYSPNKTNDSERRKHDIDDAAKLRKSILNYKYPLIYLKKDMMASRKQNDMLQGERDTEDNDNADGEVTITEGDSNGSHLKPPKAKSRKGKIHMMTDIDQKIEEAYNVFKTQTSPPDQCSLYGELLATKLGALDADTREMAMIEIDLNNRQLDIVKKSLELAKFRLRKWMSNNSTVPERFKENTDNLRILSFTNNEPVKTLGIQWSSNKDQLCYHFKSSQIDNVTKGNLLSTITNIFDHWDCLV